jgi:hypothetical protein
MMVTVYADDCLVVINTTIDHVINFLESCHFGSKFEDNLTDYLSCKVEINQ